MDSETLHYPKGEWRTVPNMRIAPLLPSQRNLFQRLVVYLARRKAGAKNELGVIPTLLKMPKIGPLYLLWLSRLLFKGRLSRADKERVVLRTVWRMGCVYEWTHHSHLAVKAGVKAKEISAIGSEELIGVSERVQSFCGAIDELLTNRILSDSTWNDLRKHISGDEAVEFLMLCGHYAMMSMVLNATGIRTEEEFAFAKMPSYSPSTNQASVVQYLSTARSGK